MMFQYFIGGIGGAVIGVIALGLAVCRSTPLDLPHSREAPRAVPFVEVEQHSSQISVVEIDRSRPEVVDLEARLGTQLLPHELAAFMTFESRTGQQLRATSPIPAEFAYLNALLESGQLKP